MGRSSVATSKSVIALIYFLLVILCRIVVLSPETNKDDTRINNAVDLVIRYV